ncbi:MAG: sensor histidine kinase [Eubacteriales bacterium]|nr:sensor histidine kinase [Eubacteriales bacterium]
MRSIPAIKHHIRRYLLIIIGMFSLLCVLFGAGMLAMNRMYTAIFDKIAISSEISGDVEYCNQYIRDYVLTKDLYYFRQYDEAIVDIGGHLEELSASASTDEAFQTVVSLQNLYDRYVITYINLYSNYSSMYKYYPQTRTYIEDYEEGVKIGGYIQDTLDDFLDMEIKNNTSQYSAMLHLFHRLTVFFLIVLAVSAVLAAVLSRRISENISRPLERLALTASRIGAGDLNAVPAVETNFQEIHLLSATFASMTASLQKALEDSREQARLELLYKETRYRALLAQIHPHFLFNLLTTVSQSAMSEGSFETVEIVGNICKYLRYSLHSMKSSVTLTEELDIIRSYVFLQKTRFSFPLDLQISIAPPLDPDEIRLPWMSLQPIVENSIVHGLEPSFELGQILILVSESGDGERIEIIIRDNGVGIPEDLLKRLNEPCADACQEKRDSIGLHNIRERLTLCYGGEEEFELQSAPGAGVSVIIRIPKELKEDYSDKREGEPYAHDTDR